MAKIAKLDDPRLLRLLELLGKLQAQIIPVEILDKKFLLGNCWFNACAQAAKEGSVVHGWLLWDDGLGVLAQHHSIWRRSGGQLIDVTPNAAGARCTVFAESINHPFDYGILRAWMGVRCRSQHDNKFERIDENGIVKDNCFSRPGGATLNPKPMEVLEIRNICANAGNQRYLEDGSQRPGWKNPYKS